MGCSAAGLHITERKQSAPSQCDSASSPRVHRRLTVRPLNLQRVEGMHLNAPRPSGHARWSEPQRVRLTGFHPSLYSPAVWPWVSPLPGCACPSLYKKWTKPTRLLGDNVYQGPGSPRKVLTELSLCKVPPQNESRPLLLRALHAQQLPGPLRSADPSPGRHSACGKSG